MKFNPTPLEFVIFLVISLLLYLWPKHGRRLRRWLAAHFHKRRGPRQLKPQSPADCPLCRQEISWLPQRARPEVVPWSARKSRRGRKKVVDTAGYACLDPRCDYFAIAV